MKRTLLTIIVIALGLAACSNSPPSTIPTSVPSGVSQTVGQAVCDIQAQLLATLTQVQASGLQSASALTGTLQDIQGRLNDQADSLESQGATPLASQLRAAADAVGQLSSAITSGDTSAMVSAGAKLSDAINKLPGCPTPSVSPSA